MVGRGFLSCSLFIRLIPPYNYNWYSERLVRDAHPTIVDRTLQLVFRKAGARGISIALVIHSVDRTLQLLIAPYNWYSERLVRGGSLSSSLSTRLIAPYKLTPSE